VTPLNWSGGEGTGYYSPTLSYRDLTYRCLMDAARPSVTRGDIPLDDIKMMLKWTFPKKSGHSRKTSPSGFDSGSGGL